MFSLPEKPTRMESHVEVLWKDCSMLKELTGGLITGVLDEAEKCELKATQTNTINSDRIPELDEILLDVYAFCHPKPIDYHNRKALVRFFNAMAKEIYGNSDDVPVVVPLGSFLMDIFTPQRDLDLSFNFSNEDGEIFPKEKKIQSLRKFKNRLYALQRRGRFSSVQPILSANVPIIKTVDRRTGIECDISIENRDGILKSQIIRMISSMDGRFRKLCFLMKAWAKAQGINNSSEGTLNSLSIVSLVAFHLQTRDPPILPPFSALFKDGIDPKAVRKVIDILLHFGKSNKESLGELFFTLLVKLAAVEKLWSNGLCASIYEGSWIFKKWESTTSKKKLHCEFSCISVEDFMDRSVNVARAVGKNKVEKIHMVINNTIYYISAFTDGQIHGSKLMELLFGSECIPAAENRSTANVDGKTVNSHITLDATVTKKMQSTGGWDNCGKLGRRSCIHSPRPNEIKHGAVNNHLDRISSAAVSRRRRESTLLNKIQPKPLRPVAVWREKHSATQLDHILPRGG